MLKAAFYAIIIGTKSSGLWFMRLFKYMARVDKQTYITIHYKMLYYYVTYFIVRKNLKMLFSAIDDIYCDIV